MSGLGLGEGRSLRLLVVVECSSVVGEFLGNVGSVESVVDLMRPSQDHPGGFEIIIHTDWLDWVSISFYSKFVLLS